MSIELEVLQELLDDSTRRHGVPGAALALADDDSVQAIVSGVGSIEDGRPVTPNTRFRIASITKLFTATMTMQLVADGRIRLEDPVRWHLPELRLRGAGDATLERITVADLLTHTSGIPGEWYDDQGNDDGCWSRLVDSLAGVELLHEPGELVSYCNSGFVVLGRLIQALTGDSWEQALRKQIVEPLGLHATGPVGPGSDGAPGDTLARSHVLDAATGCLRLGEMWPEHRTPAPAGSTLASTVGDLCRFAQDHVGSGGVLLPTELAAGMQEPRYEVDYLGHAVGLAWWHTDPQRRTVGHGGGTCAFLRGLRGTRVAVAFLSNGPAGADVYREVVEPIFTAGFGLLAVPPPPEPAWPPPSVDPDRYTGTYVHADERVEVEAGDPLTLHMGVEAPAPLFHARGANCPDRFGVPGRGDRPRMPVTFLDPHDEGRPRFVVVGNVAFRRRGR